MAPKRPPGDWMADYPIGSYWAVDKDGATIIGRLTKAEQRTRDRVVWLTLATETGGELLAPASKANRLTGRLKKAEDEWRAALELLCLMAPPPEAYWLVHGFGPTNYKHRSLEAAQAEARRLADVNPGTRFYVLQSGESWVRPTADTARRDPPAPAMAPVDDDDIPF